MKKTVLTLCLALSVLALAGCSDDGAPFQEKQYTPDAPVEAVALDVRDREIEVSLSEDGQVHIQYAESEKESYDISVSEDNVLTMTGVVHKAWTDYVGKKPAAEDRKILLALPDALLDSLTLSTTNEDISLAALTVTGSVSISANGGSIGFAGLDVGQSLELQAKNGDISGTVIGCYEEFAIQTESKKGESNLPAHKADGGKTLRVTCNHGDVDVAFSGKQE